MHIIVLENQLSSLCGGLEISVLDVCRGLAQRGHSISFIYLEEGNLLHQYQEFCTRLVKVNSYLLDRSTITNTFNFATDIWNIRTHRNSIVYCHRYHNVFFGYVLSLLRNIPFVCHLRLTPLEKFGRPHAIGLNGVKQFIALSNQTKLDWVNSGFKKEKIEVVYNGINPEIFKPLRKFSEIRKRWNIAEHTRVISYVGRLDKEKGIETIIKAFALLLKSGISTKLLIAGKPLSHSSPEAGEKYEKSLKHLTTDLGIEKYVRFLSHVADVNSVYEGSDVTLLPSLWSEPFGRVIIESMSCGTPAVASRTGGIPEILTGEFQDMLFEPGNEQDLLNTLNRMLDWRDRDRQLGERCRQHVIDNFTLDKMVDGVEKVLLTVYKQSNIL